MWSDNETDIDLLGFQVHADLIKSVVTDASLLPVTVGVFGDWGSGKSSVTKMLERSLQDNDGIATIYFNGWQFEGYDDARSALIYSILIELAEHKRLGPKIEAGVRDLIRKVDWLRLANTGLQIGVPLLTAWLSAGAGASTVTPVLPLPQPVTPDDEAQKRLLDDVAEIEFAELLNSNPANQAMLSARQFRKDFGDLIAKTELEAVVILVDDLDRCEPTRLVDTLEAIKLFLTVPNVAFVIGADERIVRHSIAKRYETEDVTQDEPATKHQTDLVTDYLEKLVQVPYYLPRLSQSEIETYMSLLYCKQHLGEHFDIIHNGFKDSRSQDITGTFDLQKIQEIANSNDVELPEKLSEELSWCSVIAPTLSDFLKGNPRQTKRLLNALVLRRRLAEAAHLENLSDQVLVKLLLLEYLRPRLFGQLYKWQASQNGTPQEISILEEWAQGEETEKLESIEDSSTWNHPSIRRWLTMHPSLTGVDLRSYFWITRDRVEGILSGVSTIPRHLRQVIFDLMELDADGLFPEELKKQIQQMPTDEQDILLDELVEKLKRSEDKRDLIWVWDGLTAIIPQATQRLFDYLEIAPVRNLPRALPIKVAAIGRENPEFKIRTMEILQTWSQDNKSGFGRAAEEALRELETGTD